MNVLKVSLLFVLLLASTLLLAQPGDPGGDPDAVPISGVEVLIGVGSLLGLYKLNKNKNMTK